VPEALIVDIARTYGNAEAAISFWGMGISQHVHGTDNARCLIALAADDGQLRPPGQRAASAAGAEQRAGRVDAGLIPMMYPDYQRVDDAGEPREVRAAWGVPAARLDPRRG
jgi:formate dehydrogenase major subunit